MKASNLIFRGIGAALVGTALPAAAQQEKPNILLINIDDLGWSDLSGNGSGYYETPNIDHLKAQGVWFSQAYAGAANSAPSRACLLTGMNTPRHGIFTVGSAARGNRSHRRLVPVQNRLSLEPGIQMLPQVLHDAGYQTAHIGKWHVTGSPLDCGMDVNVGGGHEGHPYSYFSPYRLPDLADGPAGEHLNDRLAAEAEQYLRGVDRSRPFFLYFATYAVHTPLQSPKEGVEKYRKKPKTPAHGHAKYAAMVASMDSAVGRVLQAVRELGLERTTLIVFTSDNGGVYNLSRQWPLRAGKGSFYEGGIRVPLVLYQKGKYEKATVDGVAVSQLDLFPTFLDLAGISSRRLLLDGRSWVPLLEKKKCRELEERPLFWNFPGYLEGGNAECHDPEWRSTPQAVIRKGEWKLIEFYEDGKVELYRISEDISEKHNLAERLPEKTAELLDELHRWQRNTKAPVVTEENPDYKGGVRPEAQRTRPQE